MANLNQLSYYQSSMNSNDDSMHEYVDCELINNSNSLTPQPIIYSQLKTANIIDNCADYYLSIIKWSSNSNLPVLIPSMRLSPTGAPQLFNGQTNYYVSMAYGTYPSLATFNNPTTILYTSQQPNIGQPKYNPLNQAENYNNPYYYVYNIQSFLDDVNVALYSNFLQLQTANPITLKDAFAPKFIWDSTVNKIVCIVSDEFVFNNNITGVPTPMAYLKFNNELFTLFNTFDYQQIDSDGYVFTFTEKYGMDSFQTQKQGTAISVLANKFYQSSSSVPLWSPVDSIIFSTTQIPVEFSQTGVPVYLGENIISNSNAIQNSNCVLTDFTVPMDTGLEYNFSTIVYYPQSEYRLVDLLGNGPLTFLNLIVSWRDKVGLTHQMVLKNGQSAKIKILLRKKNFGSIMM